MTAAAFLLLFVASLAGWFWNRHAAAAVWRRGARLHSLPAYHGASSALAVAVPGMVLILVWLALQGAVIDWLVLAALPEAVVAGLDGGTRALMRSEIGSIARGQVFGTPEPWKLEAAAYLGTLTQTSRALLFAAVALASAFALFMARRKVSAAFRARQRVERILHGLMVLCALAAIFTTAGIVASLAFESARFFSMVPFTEFLFGTNWEPQIPMRADQVAGAGAFGWLPVILGTLVITVVAMGFSVPVGLFSAVYLNEFASPRLRSVAKPLLEMLAGIPTVVYGFFAVLTVAPALRSAASAWGIAVAPNTALAAGGVMGIMLIPFIASFADDALSAVPRALRDGSLALGATRAETVTKVLIPAAIPGIAGGVLLAVSRAIGETMIVVMAAGLIARMTINPLDSVTTVTVQIVTLLIGDTAFDNPKTLAAFALGLMLFLVTLAINVLALRLVRKYREIYD
jgi:phosphate transport system permease protein